MPTPTDTYIENRERIKPNQTNNYDTAHGGIVMQLMDETGAMAAMRFAGEPCVTARVDGLDFVRPIPRGDIAVIEAWVYRAGETSVDVRVRVDGEDPHSGERELTSESSFRFVAITEGGNPTPVPDLAVESDRDEELRALGNDADGTMDVER
jgi:acyl-CoA hydrolase